MFSRQRNILVANYRARASERGGISPPRSPPVRPVREIVGQQGELTARSGKQQRGNQKLDKEMKSRSSRSLGTSKVILTINPGQEADAEKEIKKLGGRVGRRLKLVNGMAVELPNR